MLKSTASFTVYIVNTRIQAKDQLGIIIINFQFSSLSEKKKKTEWNEILNILKNINRNLQILFGKCNSNFQIWKMIFIIYFTYSYFDGRMKSMCVWESRSDYIIKMRIIKFHKISLSYLHFQLVR